MGFFLIRAPLLFHLIIISLCSGYILIYQVDSRTTVSSNLSCIDTERFALLNFKSGLVLDFKRNLSDWTHENMDCCRWEGIHCTKAGHVVKIDLRGPSYYDNFGLGHGHIGGEISSSLLHLSYLSYLDLSNNNFTKVPEFFGSLKRLRDLNISHNPLTGNVPHHLGNLSLLETLDLHTRYDAYSSQYDERMHANSSQYDERIEVDSLAWVVGLTSLKYLDMSSIRMGSAKDWVQSIFKLPSLKSLYLQWNDLPFPAPTEMNSSTSLEVVDLSGSDHLNFTALSPLLQASTKLVDLTFSTSTLKQCLIPDYLVKLVSLKYLHLSSSGLKGTIPETFNNLSNLITLDLSFNELEGVIPQTFSNLTRLETLILRWNNLHGNLPNLSKFPTLQVLILENNELKGGLPPQYLQRSSNLIKLDVSFNQFHGILTESFFLNLTNLQVLSLSFNTLTLNLSTRFTPPFQLQVLNLGACKLGKVFPHWLRTQETLTELDISDSGISDDIPSWFWNMSSKLTYLNVSHNSISGYLPPDSLSSCDIVDLSSNRFYGALPSISNTLSVLILSNNAFLREITSLCGVEGMRLRHLDLSNNYFSGILPNCWKNFGTLYSLNLNNNAFTGSLPNSIGLSSLMSLSLGNNNFSGNLPQSLEKCTELSILDLGKNKFSGRVPDWIGTSVTNLVVLRLNSNKFEGDITCNLCRLKWLQILDLSSNNISGIIPSCLKNLTIMTYNGTTFPRGVPSFFYGRDDISFSIVDYITASLYWKGNQSEFNRKTVELLRLIDLSSNKLNGFIPEELTSLEGLDVLNLAHNDLIGSIPNKIGQMRMLEVLDLSHNQLSGEIPLSITKLTTLNYLDMSFNHLNGSIPVSTQLSTFDAIRFMGNLGLCGDPLPSCYRGKNVNHDSQYTEEGDVENNFPWMYISTSLGFIVGFWGVCGTLLIKKSWAERYFQCLTHITERLHVAILIGLANLRHKFTN